MRLFDDVARLEDADCDLGDGCGLLGRFCVVSAGNASGPFHDPSRYMFIACLESTAAHVLPWGGSPLSISSPDS